MPACDQEGRWQGAPFVSWEGTGCSSSEGQGPGRCSFQEEMSGQDKERPFHSRICAHHGRACGQGMSSLPLTHSPSPSICDTDPQEKCLSRKPWTAQFLGPLPCPALAPHQGFQSAPSIHLRKAHLLNTGSPYCRPSHRETNMDGS